MARCSLALGFRRLHSRFIAARSIPGSCATRHAVRRAGRWPLARSEDPFASRSFRDPRDRGRRFRRLPAADRPRGAAPRALRLRHARQPRRGRGRRAGHADPALGERRVVDAGRAHRHLAPPRLLQSRDRRACAAAAPSPTKARSTICRTRRSCRTPRSSVAKRSCRVRDAIERLPARQRTAVLLFHFQDFSQRDAASVMGVSEDAFESMLARARRQLKRLLGDGEGEAAMSERHDLFRRLAVYGSDLSRWPERATEAKAALLRDPGIPSRLRGRTDLRRGTSPSTARCSTARSPARTRSRA